MACDSRLVLIHWSRVRTESDAPQTQVVQCIPEVYRCVHAHSHIVAVSGCQCHTVRVSYEENMELTSASHQLHKFQRVPGGSVQGQQLITVLDLPDVRDRFQNTVWSLDSVTLPISFTLHKRALHAPKSKETLDSL